jgi:hypothetical protein
MYSIQALWTAAHHKLPLTVVIVNNGGYRIISSASSPFMARPLCRMDFADPKVDFTRWQNRWGWRCGLPNPARSRPRSNRHLAARSKLIECDGGRDGLI